MCSPRAAPKTAAMATTPTALQHYYQFQVLLKPSPPDIQDLYLDSLRAIGLDTDKHDIRFVEDDWENPTLGAWGLGWEVWCDGMEVTQFTYFQQVGGIDCWPVAGEITYGLERLVMYLQGIEDVYDLDFNGLPPEQGGKKYRDVFLRNEQEQSAYNFEHANTDELFKRFTACEAESQNLIKEGLALPAYDQMLLCGHTFNLLDARGVISVVERASYIGRVRALAKACCELWVSAPNNAGKAA
jgi:glycyl-tRNA synthetase alpha chain